MKNAVSPLLTHLRRHSLPSKCASPGSCHDMPPQWRNVILMASEITSVQPLAINRDSEVIMFSPCLFVCLHACVCLCLSRCLSGRFNYEGLVPHNQFYASTFLGMSGFASYVSRTHDVIDDVTMTQSSSNFDILMNWYMSVNIWARASIKSSYVGNANGHLSVISNCRYNFR